MVAYAIGLAAVLVALYLVVSPWLAGGGLPWPVDPSTGPNLPEEDEFS